MQKKITEGVVKDEYLHLNYGQEWLKENLSTCKEELMEANKVNLPVSYTHLRAHETG